MLIQNNGQTRKGDALGNPATVMPAQPDLHTLAPSNASRLVRLLACVLLGCAALTQKAAELPPHPRLLLDSNGVAQLKQRLGQAPWAKAEWDKLKRNADLALEKGVELPPRGGNWSHNYVCPVHGARLSQGAPIGPWQWEHRCAAGQHTLRGDPSQATLDFDGNAISSAHFNLAREAVEHGLVFQVSGDDRQARRARAILLAYAERYLAYPMHNNQGRPSLGGRVASQSLTEASWLIEILQGADLVWQTLNAPERQAIASQMVMPALNEIILKGKYGVHNIQCRLNSAIGLAGFLLDNPALIDRAINDPASGYRRQMDTGVLDDGMWTEGSSGYHFFTIAGLWPLTEAARNCGVDLYGPKFRSMFEGPLSLAMPNFVLPDFNDSGMVSLAREEEYYELAYARYHSPLCVPLLAQSERRNLMALLFGVVDLPEGGLPDAASRNSQASGYAILQQGPGAAATWLCVKYGPHGGGHGHPDKNHFLLYARGQVVAPDGGTHAYGSPLHHGWDKSTFSHNTLVLNESSQKPATGRCLAFGSEKGVEYSITDAGAIYPDTRFIRTVALLTPQWIVIVDQVASGKTQTMDIVYHQMGAWDAIPMGNSWQPARVPGYQYVSEAVSSLDLKTLKTRISQDWKPHVVLAGNEPTEVICGYGILKTTQDRVPVLIQRRQARQTAFVWCVALDGQPVSLKVRPIPNQPTAEALVVEAADGVATRQLLVNPFNQAVEAAADWHSAASFEVR